MESTILPRKEWMKYVASNVSNRATEAIFRIVGSGMESNIGHVTPTHYLEQFSLEADPRLFRVEFIADDWVRATFHSTQDAIAWRLETSEAFSS